MLFERTAIIKTASQEKQKLMESKFDWEMICHASIRVLFFLLHFESYF